MVIVVVVYVVPSARERKLGHVCVNKQVAEACVDYGLCILRSSNFMSVEKRPQRRKAALAVIREILMPVSIDIRQINLYLIKQIPLLLFVE